MAIHSSLDADGVRTIRLDRPPANALDLPALEALREAFIEADRDWDTKVVVLEGEGERFFCAGLDVKAPFPPEAELPKAAPSYGAAINRAVFQAIHDCGAPVIAKVRGAAVGAGFFYACLADFTIAGDRAKFGQFEIKVGAVGGAGIVRRMLSEQAMRYLSWTGALVGAAELAALGAGVRVVPDAALDEVVGETARLLASRDAALNRHTKMSFNQVEGLGALEAFAVEQMHSELLARRGR
jgi:enoyl-CoA hydratase/carnithine racemase